MSQRDVTPLPRRLTHLLRAERETPKLSDDAMTRLSSRLEATLGMPPLPPAPTPSPRPPAPPAPPSGIHRVLRALWRPGPASIVALAIGGAGGAAIMAAQPSPAPTIVYVPGPPVPVTVTVTVPAAPVPASPVPEVTVDKLPLVAPRASTPVASARPVATAAPVAVAADRGLAEERSVLDAARAALGRRDGAAALTQVDEHTRRFPRGALSEEREAIAVQALSVSGRAGEARARAAAFVARHPNSLFRPAIDPIAASKNELAE